MANKTNPRLNFKYVEIGGSFYDGQDTGTGKPEMNFDIISMARPSEIIFANLTINEAIMLRDRIDEFIHWAAS